MRLKLDGNYELLLNCSGKDRVKLLVNEFTRFLCECGEDDRFYRLHWSGDFFSADYARDVMKACKEIPEVRFWNFTRNFDKDVVRCIRRYKPDNLVQYLSADPCNVRRALQVYTENPETFAMSYMGENAAPFAALWKAAGQRSKIMPCPSNFKHNTVEYMCKKCRMCLKGKCVHFRTRR